MTASLADFRTFQPQLADRSPDTAFETLSGRSMVPVRWQEYCSCAFGCSDPLRSLRAVRLQNFEVGTGGGCRFRHYPGKIALHSVAPSDHNESRWTPHSRCFRL